MPLNPPTCYLIMVCSTGQSSAQGLQRHSSSFVLCKRRLMNPVHVPAAVNACPPTIGGHPDNGMGYLSSRYPQCIPWVALPQTFEEPFTLPCYFPQNRPILAERVGTGGRFGGFVKKWGNLGLECKK